MDPIEREKSLFEALFTLRKALGDNKALMVIHPGEIWEASFAWRPPAQSEAVRDIEAKLDKKLPEDLFIFITKISDGATLFYDTQYGQWGYQIYSCDELQEREAHWKSMFEEDWMPYFIAIGESIDDLHPIIANMEKTTPNKMSYQLIEGDALDPIEYWKKVSPSFNEWLGHLITAQGAKFWDWRSD